MKPITDQTIGEIVTDNYQAASVFQSFGIDFCCGGKRTLHEACTKQGVEEEKVLKALLDVNQSKREHNHNFKEWELPFLIDYIQNVHHTYVRKKCPEIREYAQKVAKVHGERRPETKQVAHLFQALEGELMNHLEKEEAILFPYVKMLAVAESGGKQALTPAFGSARNPIKVMESEHEAAGDMLKELRRITDQFRPPADACTTYRVLYASLEEFEKDLHQHVHLENNILFPKAIELEANVTAGESKL